MLKTQFKDKVKFDIYIAEQKVRMEKGYLTRSERDSLKKMLDKNYKPIFIKEEKPKGKSIVTNIRELRKPCLPVEKGEDISQIIKDLKETLNRTGGLGLTANQIGYNKRISYIRTPYYNPKKKKVDFKEYLLINTKIIEKDRPTKIMNETCLSFPKIEVITKRYVFITIENYNENLEVNILPLQDTDALVVQHEVDHQNGITIFNRKWRAK